jgi:hypothetical protein
VSARIRLSGVPVEADEAGRMLWASTSRRSFWSQPGIEALLEPSGHAGRQRSREAPSSRAELVASLARCLGAWPEQRRALREELLAASRSFVAALEALDAGLGELRRDFAADEAPRLLAKLEALGPAAEAEPAERREMRALLTRQRDLVRGLEQRIAQAERERERLLARLRRLWELSHAVGDPARAEAEPLLDQLERLCREPSAETEPATFTRPN